MIDNIDVIYKVVMGTFVVLLGGSSLIFIVAFLRLLINYIELMSIVMTSNFELYKKTFYGLKISALRSFFSIDDEYTEYKKNLLKSLKLLFKSLFVLLVSVLIVAGFAWWASKK